METVAYLQLAQNYESFELLGSDFEPDRNVKISEKTAASIVGITGAVLVGSVMAAPASAYGSDSSAVSANCCSSVSNPVSANCCVPVVVRPVASSSICCRPVVVRPIVVRPIVVRPVVSSSICCQPVVQRPIYYPESCQQPCYDSQAYSTPSYNSSDYYSYDYSNYSSYDYSNYDYSNYSNYDYSNYSSYSSAAPAYPSEQCNCAASSTSGNYQISYDPATGLNSFPPASETMALPQQGHIDASIAPNMVDGLHGYQAEIAARVY
jgi:hypothetical protein